MSRIIAALLVLLFAAGCNDLAVQTYQPYPDVQLTANFRKTSHHDSRTFLHIKYVVALTPDEPLYLNVGSVSMRANGSKNDSAHYDTYASIVPHWQPIKRGKTEIELYASYPGRLEIRDTTDVKILDFGFAREIDEKEDRRGD